MPSPQHPADEPAPALDLSADPAQLTAALIDVESVSDHETRLADLVEDALRGLDHLSVHRDGDAIVARTELGRPERVVLAGHLDTVPLPSIDGARGTVPSSWTGSDDDGDLTLWGRGATDMKGGVAVQLGLAAQLTRPARDITYVFYDHEEVDSAASGLGRLERSVPELLEADFAVLLEPTDGTVEGGCNGTLRFVIAPQGLAAHSGRAWRGDNAIHKLADVLAVLAEHEPATIEVAADFVAAVGQEPKPKYGWTDVARFSAMGVPAVNFGPGDALLAHTDDEHVSAAAIRECRRVLLSWLSQDIA